ncbi:MAG: hypothetical protein KAS32_19465 [Candidatus Peribacteraceae bacterium]|nr:hypothetical protein [Candidatus Peribacteraceae bacterium]
MSKINDKFLRAAFEQLVKELRMEASFSMENKDKLGEKMANEQFRWRRMFAERIQCRLNYPKKYV